MGDHLSTNVTPSRPVLRLLIEMLKLVLDKYEDWRYPNKSGQHGYTMRYIRDHLQQALDLMRKLDENLAQDEEDTGTKH